MGNGKKRLLWIGLAGILAVGCIWLLWRWRSRFFSWGVGRAYSLCMWMGDMIR